MLRPCHLSQKIDFTRHNQGADQKEGRLFQSNFCNFWTVFWFSLVQKGTLSYFMFARQWLDSFTFLPWLPFSWSRSQVHDSHPEQTHPFFLSRPIPPPPTPQKWVPGSQFDHMLQNSKCFAPSWKHYPTSISQCVIIFKYAVNPSTFDVEGWALQGSTRPYLANFGVKSS